MRASDADRARVSERLRQATLEGRLLAAEFDERLESALRARTYGDLDAVVADLPAGQELTVRRTRGRVAILRRPAMVRIAAALAATAMTALIIAAAPSLRSSHHTRSIRGFRVTRVIGGAPVGRGGRERGFSAVSSSATARPKSYGTSTG